MMETGIRSWMTWVSSREINQGTAVSRYYKVTERLDPLTDLKQRLSFWGRSNSRKEGSGG